MDKKTPNLLDLLRAKAKVKEEHIRRRAYFERSFSSLYLKLQASAIKITRNHYDADDLVQQTYLRLLRLIDSGFVARSPLGYALLQMKWTWQSNNQNGPRGQGKKPRTFIPFDEEKYVTPKEET